MRDATAVTGSGRLVFAVVVAGLLSANLYAAPAHAGANRCGTASPERPPTWIDGAGEHWADEHGVWTEAQESSLFGHGGVDLDGGSAEADPWANHSLQIHAGADRSCLAVGTTAGEISPGGLRVIDDVGEFPIQPAPAIVTLPWLERDGMLLRGSDGRTTILRGVDWPYNQEVFEAPYNLTGEDFDRIASWGLNLLRIRISAARSGFLPNTTAEPGYWENLDQIIAGANSRGIYVMPSTTTNDIEAMQLPTGHDQLKFIEGTSNQSWWLAYQAALFERYRDWPGVVGFDPLNEDYSYPVYIHDRFFVGALHRKANTALRSSDDRHVYFQEPSGYSYFGSEYWPGQMQGHDLGDPNRFHCPKYHPGGNAEGDLPYKERLAVESNAPMFLCEMWIDTRDPATVELWQRDAQAAMDRRLMGGVRILYGPSAGYGTHTREGVEAHWIREFARPYPAWAGGVITGVSYDYDLRRLVSTYSLDGSGPTEIFVGQTRTYPDGFEATASNGAHLVHDGSGVTLATGMSFDAARQRVVLASGIGTVSITINPTP